MNMPRPGRLFFRYLAPCLAALAVLAGRLSAGAEDAARPEAAEAEADFTPLLEGDVANKWVGYGSDKWPKGWEAADGVLHRHASGGDLRTVDQYADFDLRFEWKVAPGGNSGVIYRASQQKAPAYRTGPEYQVLDDARHKDGRSPLTSAGSLYGLYAPSVDAVRPAGQWNRSRIVAQGKHIRHFLNDKKVVDCRIGSEDWIERLAKSKFASWKGYGKNDRGYIVLQDHGDEAWFRNMRIKELNAE